MTYSYGELSDATVSGVQVEEALYELTEYTKDIVFREIGYLSKDEIYLTEDEERGIAREIEEQFTDVLRGLIR